MFQCSACEKQSLLFLPLKEFTESYTGQCPYCKETVEHELVVQPSGIEDWGQGRYFEDLAHNGKTFYDKRSYKEHLKKNSIIEWSPKTGMPGSGI